MSSNEPGPLTSGQRWSLVAAALCAAGALALAALPMDWIEEVFGVEPDGGNGLLEFAPIVALAVAAVALCARVARARRRVHAPAADSV